MKKDHEKLFAIARGIARALDTKDALLARQARVGCHTTNDDAWTYSDDAVILVFCKTDKSGLIERRANNNPVVSFRADGSICRYHGELIHIVEHIRKLGHPLNLLARAT